MDLLARYVRSTPKPRDVKNPRVVAMLELFADTIGRSHSRPKQRVLRRRTVGRARAPEAKMQERICRGSGYMKPAQFSPQR